MDSGDNENSLELPVISNSDKENIKRLPNNNPEDEDKFDTKLIEPIEPKNISPQVIDNHENNLRDRIAQCRSVIEALKHELNEEKFKLENVYKSTKKCSEHDSKCTVGFQNLSAADDLIDDQTFSSSVYSACVDSKLSCDESLVQYEQQLQKYQNTLYIAQMQKKNAIRKQMLAKAYRLKLLEIENQCNIELLRVKQSFQCLEPLKVIASKWKKNTDELYDSNSFDLLPRYPDFSSCASNVGSIKELEVNTDMEKSEKCVKNESVFSDN